MDFTNKTVLVTGSSRGIGKAIAFAFGRAGARVVLNASRSKDQLAEAKKELEEMGVSCMAVLADVSDYNACKDMFLQIQDTFGSVDILVNNAGIIRYGRPEEISHKDWTECIDVDVTGTWLMSKEVVNASMLEKGGRIVNICSVNSFSASPAAVVYHVAKAAEAALTKSCAAAWAGHGIYVNGIAPGNMQNGEMAPDTPPAILENIRNKVPQRRLGQYGDLSGALLFLASDANTYTQGTIIVCDGGLILESF